MESKTLTKNTVINVTPEEEEVIKIKENLRSLLLKFMDVEKENMKLRKMVYRKFRSNRRRNENYYKSGD